MKKLESPGVQFDITDYAGNPSGCQSGLPAPFRDIQVGAPTDSVPWVLRTGYWNDNEPWVDTELWDDGDYVLPDASFTIMAKPVSQAAAGEISVMSNVSTIQFADESVGYPITEHFWEFGDGHTSTEVNPRHTYTRNRVYTVTLTVTDRYGLTSRRVGQVSVSAI